MKYRDRRKDRERRKDRDRRKERLYIMTDILRRTDI